MEEIEQQQGPTSCSECGGQRVLTECDPRMNIMVSLFSVTRLQALVCIECGYTTLYVKEPFKLRQKLFGQ